MGARKQQQPTFKYMISINGGPLQDMADMTPERRKEIGQKLYDRMVRAMGYVPVEEVE